MNRHRTLSPLTLSALFALCLFAVWLCAGGAAPSAAQSKGDGAAQQDAAKSAPVDLDTLAAQVKALQKQVAALQAPAAAASGPRIIAAGTATWHRPGFQNNRTTARVKLTADIAAKLGTDYIVQLTSRYPKGGYPFFVPYWQPANDGFDVVLVDPTIDGEGETSSYPNPNTAYLIDWVVVKK